MFGGDDKNPKSGKLELRYHDGRPSYISEGFLMENTEQVRAVVSEHGGARESEGEIPPPPSVCCNACRGGRGDSPL